MQRFIVLDANNKVIRTRFGAEIVAGEIQSDLGNIGDIKQLNGSFVAPPVVPVVDPVTALKAAVDKLTADMTVKLDGIKSDIAKQAAVKP